MPNILFVCHGNICRSPMAELVFRELCRREGLACAAESCAVSAEELGNGIYPPARRKLREKGIPLEDHRARQFSAADYGRFDVIYVMDRGNLRGMLRKTGNDPGRKLRLLLSAAGRDGDVADPWYTGDFEQAYRDILDGCRGILAALRRGEAL